MLLVNFQSTRNKKPDLIALINAHKPDVLAGTETWLTPDVKNGEIIPPELEYTIYRKDRLDGYGGVMLAVSNKILSVDLPSLTTDCEIIWAKLCIAGSPAYVAAYYRPHISDEYSLTQLDLSLHKLNESINNPLINWRFQPTRDRLVRKYCRT